MDIATIGGLVVCFVLVIFGITFNQDTMSIDFVKLGSFINYPSMIITFGGSFMAVFTASKSIKAFVNNLSFLLSLSF